MVLSLLLVGSLHAQKLPPPLPPDMLHISKRGCHIDGHQTDPPEYTLDAKTGDVHTVEAWTVTPFVTYKDLPDGTKREDWVAPKPLGIFIGTEEADIPALAACNAWMKQLDKARLEEAHKAGH